MLRKWWHSAYSFSKLHFCFIVVELLSPLELLGTVWSPHQCLCLPLAEGLMPPAQTPGLLRPSAGCAHNTAAPPQKVLEMPICGFGETSALAPCTAQPLGEDIMRQQVERGVKTLSVRRKQLVQEVPTDVRMAVPHFHQLPHGIFRQETPKKIREAQGGRLMLCSFHTGPRSESVPGAV